MESHLKSLWRCSILLGTYLTRTSKYLVLYFCQPLGHLDFTFGAPDLRLHLKGNKGIVDSHAGSIGDEEKDVMERSHDGISAGKGSSKWVKVNEKRTLWLVLKKSNLLIPRIPVSYVVSKRSSFYKEFRDGKWFFPS